MVDFVDKRRTLGGNSEMCLWKKTGLSKWKEPKCIRLRCRDWTFLSNVVMIEIYYVLTANICLLGSDAVYIWQTSR